MKQRTIYSLITIAVLLFLSFNTGSYVLLSNKIDKLQRVATSDLIKLNNRLIDLGADASSITTPLKTPEYGQLVTVTKVIDGDTIELEDGERLRYIGIDTPEKNDPRKPVQCFADKATQKNITLVEGKKIKFYKDVAVRDKYQRLLGYVYLEDGTFINLELVKTGFAFSYPYPPDISKQEEFNKAQSVARENNLGLWSGCTVTETSTGRQQTNNVIE